MTYSYSTSDIVLIATGTVFLTLVVVLSYLSGGTVGAAVGLMAFGLAYISNMLFASIGGKRPTKLMMGLVAVTALGCFVLTVASALSLIVRLAFAV